MSALASLRTIVREVDGERVEVGKTLMFWCPGCAQTHRVGVEGHPGGEVWEWNGDLVNVTVSPSILAFSTVHLCPPDYVHEVPCEEYPGCTHLGHGLGPNGERMRRLPCVAEPNYGNCHSFLRDGVWDFLSDSAHALAGHRVPMVPLPDHFQSPHPEAS